MTRQTLNRGTTANDGTGDTLRQAALKIEQNFEEIYLKLGGDSSVLMPLVSFDSDGLLFEGTTVNNFETKLTAVDPTADRTVTIPDHTGEVTLNDATQTLSNKTVIDPAITAPTIFADSSDAFSYSLVTQEPAANRNITIPLLTGNDEFTFNSHTQTLSNKTLNAPVLNNPRIGTEIQDSSGNQYLELASSGSPVNHLKITSNATGNSPILSAVGNDTNINLNLGAKGTGGVKIQSKLILDYQVMSVNGAVDLNKPLTFFSSGGGVSATMPDGTERGEIKYLMNQNSGPATITPTNLQNFTTITLDVDQSCTLVWGGTDWVVLNTGGDSDGGILA